MTEANNPEISVNELIEKIREEVSLRRSSTWSTSLTTTTNMNLTDPEVANEEDVYYCYRLLLERTPDNDGWNIWSSAVKGGAVSIKTLVSAFLEASELKNMSVSPSTFEQIQVPETHIQALANSESHIQALVNNAESRAQVRTKWPDKLARFPFNISKKFQKLALKTLEIILRDQHEVNFNILQALREFLLINRQSAEQTATLQAQVSAIYNRLNVVEEHVRGTATRLNVVEEHMRGTATRLNVVEEHVRGTNNRLNAVEERVSATDSRLNVVEEHVRGTDTRLNVVEEHVRGTATRLNVVEEHVRGTATRLNVVEEHVRGTDTRLNVVEEHVRGTDTRLNVVEEHVRGTDTRLNVVEEHVRGTDTRLNVVEEHVRGTDTRLNVVEEHVRGTDKHLNLVEERHIRDESYLKNDLAQQKRLITLFIDEARQRLPEPFNQEQLQTLVNEDQHSLDALYISFEDQFRGSREQIRDKLNVYLPLIEEAKLGTQNSPILDVGCGRGEWLELLRASGYIARGLDINRVALDQCRAKKFDVIEEDALSYLRTLPSDNLGAVTGFHIIEHLSFEILVNLLDEIWRVVKPGGLIILETPNPQNVLVGSCNFYFDPTHRNPLPSPMIKFMVESRGFGKVKIIDLQPFPDTVKVHENGSELEKQFNRYFYGAQDYAVVGVKL